MTDPREALVETVWISHTQTRYDAEDIADAILAAGWTPPGERAQCDHERAAREMARVTPLRAEDTLRMIEAMAELSPPTVKPSVEGGAR